MRNSLLVLVSLCLSAWGQAKGPSFDVTSVKPLAVTRDGAGTQPACIGGRFIAVTPLVQVIQWAYQLTTPAGLLNQQLDKSGSNRVYEIQGSTDRAVTEAECRQMVRALLADRFKFAGHMETKEGRVYDLLIARGGHKLQRVTEADQGPGVTLSLNGSAARNPGNLRGMTMSDFAKFLSTRMTSDRLSLDPVPVFDKTGLDGMYKITLAYSIPRLAPKQTFSDPELEGAIQQQLGLRLEERKGPVDSFVIDHIEAPTAN